MRGPYIFQTVCVQMNWWRAKQKEDMFLFLVQFQLLFHHFLFYKKVKTVPSHSKMILVKSIKSLCLSRLMLCWDLFLKAFELHGGELTCKNYQSTNTPLYYPLNPLHTKLPPTLSICQRYFINDLFLSFVEMKQKLNTKHWNRFKLFSELFKLKYFTVGHLTEKSDFTFFFSDGWLLWFCCCAALGVSKWSVYPRLWRHRSLPSPL